MKDINYMEFDDLLFNSLIDYFNLDFEDEENLKKYKEFRNNLVDLIDEIIINSGS
tara:strand:- start:253 stop:417 length:165 start_codon:yes stop_codon:yes gene_type:complete